MMKKNEMALIKAHRPKKEKGRANILLNRIPSFLQEFLLCFLMPRTRMMMIVGRQFICCVSKGVYSDNNNKRVVARMTRFRDVPYCRLSNGPAFSL